MMRNDELKMETATAAQKAAYQMLADLVGGEHHISGKIYPATKRGIEAVIANGGWSTFDLDRLTKAVLMAHDRAIRVEIAPCNFRMLRIFLHKRERDGSINRRHPTIEQALGKFRRPYNRE